MYLKVKKNKGANCHGGLVLLFNIDKAFNTNTVLYDIYS